MFGFDYTSDWSKKWQEFFLESQSEQYQSKNKAELRLVSLISLRSLQSLVKLRSAIVPIKTTLQRS